MTKPIWNKNTDELNFYEEYFKTVNSWVDNFAQMNDEAMRLGGKYGLGAMDALHIAASHLTKVDEFITAERPTSPLSRVKEFTVLSIH